MKIHISSLMFVFLAYGSYILGKQILNAVETYKGIEITTPVIPISTAFFFILMAIVFAGEVTLIVIANMFGE